MPALDHFSKTRSAYTVGAKDVTSPAKTEEQGLIAELPNGAQDFRYFRRSLEVTRANRRAFFFGLLMRRPVFGSSSVTPGTTTGSCFFGDGGRRMRSRYHLLAPHLVAEHG